MIQALEGILFQNALFNVLGQERAGIVAAETEGHLGEVVGSKGEELGFGSDLIGYNLSLIHI